MTLLTVAQAIALNVSVEPPRSVTLNPDQDCVLIIQHANEAAEEVARRVDWAATRNMVSVVGTGGDVSFKLPDDFDRLIVGNAVVASGDPVRGGLSPDEWASITPSEGMPRYFRVGGGKIWLHPFPPLGQTVQVTYQSKNWCPSGAQWGSDSETAFIPEDLIAKGAVWRWRRRIGADYQDYLAEFEAALTDRARIDDGGRQP